MINTCDFKTKTMMLERKNPVVGNYYPVAIDIGYSGVKCFAPNKAFCFPSYAKKCESQLLSIAKNSLDENCIQYKDENGVVWVVGSSAIDMLDTHDTKDSVNAVFGRNRYFSEMFLVLVRTSLGIALLENQYGNANSKQIVIQTGLPPAYMRSDTALIKEAMAGNHHFSLKIGNNNWKTFRVTLAENNIRVMAQPMGTLVSISTNNEGQSVPEAEMYFRKKMIIFDPGFGTLDIFEIQNSRLTAHETFDDLGMKRVMQGTSKDIYKNYNTEIPVLALQKFLAEGTILQFNRKEHKNVAKPFGEILEQQSKNVCKEALDRIDNIFNNFIEHDYFVVTGGTGEAWFSYIKQYFKDMSNLTIIPGNQNDNLPFIFANVRGYYMYLLTGLNRQGR